MTKHAMYIMAGDSDDAKKVALKKLSPIEFIKKGDQPTILFFGSYDDFLKDARSFAAKSTALGNRVDLWVAVKTGHGFFNGPPWQQATLIKTDEFLASLGYLAGPPTLKGVDASAVLVKEEPAAQPQTAPNKP